MCVLAFFSKIVFLSVMEVLALVAWYLVHLVCLGSNDVGSNDIKVSMHTKGNRVFDAINRFPNDLTS